MTVWYAQINQSKPVRINPSRSTAGRPSSSKSQWTFTIPRPESLSIVKIFTRDTLKRSYSVQITVGSLPPFHLGVLDNDTPALQTEPNFPIQRGTGCNVTISESAPIRIDPRKVAELKQGLTVNSFNGHFKHFMDALSYEWSGVFMQEIQKRIGNNQLSENQELDKATMYQLIKKLHAHAKSKDVNHQFKRAMINVREKREMYSKKQ